MYEYTSGAFDLPTDHVIGLSTDSIGPGVGAIIVLIILIYTSISYYYNRNGSTLTSLAILQLSFFFLLFGYAMYSTSTTVSAVDFWTRISYMGLSISPIFGISFIEVVVKRSFKRLKYITIFNCFPCISGCSV